MNKYLISSFLFSIVFATSVMAQSTAKPNPKALEAMTKGNFRGAIQILDADIAESKNLFDSYRLRSDLKKMTGDFTGALADLDKAIEIKSDDGPLYQRRAELHMITGHGMTEILSDLNSAISYGIKHEKVFALRGMIRSKTGDLDGAISDYETAIGLRPGFAQAYLGLSAAYRRKGDEEKGIQTLENFIAFVENSDIKTPTVKGNVTASNTVNIPQISDNKVRVTQNSVVIIGERRDGGPPSPEEMIQHQDSMEQSKNTALAYTNLASLYEKRKEYEKAFALVEKGLAIDPTDFYGFETRGKIKIGLNDYAGALSDLDKAANIMPKSGDIYLDRGTAYLMLGRNDEAQKDFDKYLQLFPKGKAEVDRRIEEARKKREQQ